MPLFCQFHLIEVLNLSKFLCFGGINFGLKYLLHVKHLTFCNSGFWFACCRWELVSWRVDNIENGTNLKVDLSKAQRYGQCCHQDRDMRTSSQIKSSNWTLVNLIDYPGYIAPVQLLLEELDKSSNEDLQMIVTHWICGDKSFNTSSISKDKASRGYLRYSKVRLKEVDHEFLSNLGAFSDSKKQTLLTIFQQKLNPTLKRMCFG